MSMTYGFKVESADITKLIRDKVADYLRTATNEGVGTIPTGESTKVSWDSTQDTVKTQNEAELAKFAHAKLDANELYNIIIKCLWNACCVYWQKYSYYPYTRGTNNNPPKPDLETKTYRGVLTTKHKTEAEYRAAQPQSTFAGSPYNIPMKSQTVKPFRLKDILDVLVQYNTSLEETIDHGTLNACYSSCHSNCHGSSRSRR